MSTLRNASDAIHQPYLRSFLRVGVRYLPLPALAQARNLLLLVGSYVFFGWCDWRYLGLIMLCTMVDFCVARQLHRTEEQRRRQLWLLVSCTTNLGLLVTFKYFNFFSASFAALGATVGWLTGAFTLEVFLPVGISFYTFQTLGYTIDVYRRELEPEQNLLPFAVFVAFFTQLVAGPIERAKRMLPQFRVARTV